LDELVRRSQQLLALLPAGAGESRRVCWQPDARLVRYYTTLGLLDRPAELRGRTAYYRDRHLLQLLAIKTLQARGLSLQAAQTQLAGQPDAALATLIGLPPDWAARLSAEEAEPVENRPLATESGIEQAAMAAPARFWERTPGPVMPPSESTAVAPTEPVTELLAVTLAPGARLLLDRRRYPELDDRLEAALHTLRVALRAVARSPQDPSDGDEPW
jgi:DNA-binding transcriptional MerR regulator